MIEHPGIVQTKGDGVVMVLITQSSACSSCHAKGACTAADKSEKLVEALVIDNNLEVGDAVIVYGQRKLGMKAVLWAFVIPFVILFVTLLLLQQTGLSEAWKGDVPADGTLQILGNSYAEDTDICFDNFRIVPKE